MNSIDNNNGNIDNKYNRPIIQDIDIYIYIDLNLEKQDFDLIEKCIKLHLQVHHNNYIVSRIICCNDIIEKTQTEDVIKNGLLTFHNMFRNLKLRGRNPIWFIYLSNGDIQDKYKNKCVLLLNTQPNKKECYYCIHTTPFLLRDKSESPLSRQDRIIQFKNLNINLKNLFVQLENETVKKIYY